MLLLVLHGWLIILSCSLLTLDCSSLSSYCSLLTSHHMWSIYLCVEIENGTAFDKIKWTWDSLYWNIWQGTLYDDKFQLGTNWFNFVLCSSPAIFKSTKVILLLSACQSSIMFQPFTVSYNSPVFRSLPDFHSLPISRHPRSPRILPVCHSLSAIHNFPIIQNIPVFHGHSIFLSLPIFNVHSAP